MLEIGENWLGLVNSCIYYATLEIYQVLGSFEIHWVRQYLIDVVLFGIKNL